MAIQQAPQQLNGNQVVLGGVNDQVLNTVAQRIFDMLSPSLAPMIDSLQEMEGKVARNDRWQEAHEKWPDFVLTETRNQMEYNTLRDVGRLLEVAVDAQQLKDALELINRARTQVVKRAAIVTTGDREGWHTASSLAMVGKDTFLGEMTKELAEARKVIRSTKRKEYSKQTPAAKEESADQSAYKRFRRGADGGCFTCGSKKHRVRDCPVAKRYPRGDGGSGAPAVGGH